MQRVLLLLKNCISKDCHRKCYKLQKTQLLIFTNMEILFSGFLKILFTGIGGFSPHAVGGFSNIYFLTSTFWIQFTLHFCWICTDNLPLLCICSVFRIVFLYLPHPQIYIILPENHNSFCNEQQNTTLSVFLRGYLELIQHFLVGV